jgi:hypothetical protein
MAVKVDKAEAEQLIKKLNESCMKKNDTEKLIAIIKEWENAKIVSLPLGQNFAPSGASGTPTGSADAIALGSYDIGRDIFHHWHKCAYYIEEEKKCCGYRNIISEYDPENPPKCQKEGARHRFTPCPKG